VKGLKASIDQTPTRILQDATSRDILDISTKCSGTASVLLAELGKLQPDSRRELLESISKGFRAIRRKSFIDKVQRQLEEYRRILDTRILVRLDAHSLQQRQDFQSLDQSVQSLVGAMNQGHNTFAQLLADNRQALIDHVDRGLASHAQLNRDLKARQKFKDSLFFPEILARQEQIPEAYLGTCRWIFCLADTDLRSLQSSSAEDINGEEDQRERSDSIAHSENGANHTDEDVENGPQEFINASNEELPQQIAAHTVDKRGQTWSDFVDWLEHGEGIYWINGKPGSGKSTLMSFITSEHQTKEFLTNWSSGSDLITASFFFWNPGQKSFQGLLRSLLYQIADQRLDLISTMMNQEASSAETTGESLDSIAIHTWTEKRLLSVLQRFLIHKPSSISICIFIDGLDEFVGEEESLLNTIRLLNDTKQVKVCASSRREQLFLQDFKHSPQLKLQDFNHEDIANTARGKLRPVLERLFPHEATKIGDLLDDVSTKAQGVFLWLELMIKDILRGARNGDTMQELATRLHSTPDTIEDLYKHMLNRLDKSYLSDATKYFRFMLICKPMGVPLSLMHFVCAEHPLWHRILNNDLAYFESAEFFDTCHNLETRILTRCAGLVEISELSTDLLDIVRSLFPGYLPQVRQHQGEKYISRHVRKVSFIHRTAVDFLKSHCQDFFQEPNWRSEAQLAYANSQLGCLSIFPHAISETYTINRVMGVGVLVKGLMRAIAQLDDFEVSEQIDRPFEDDAVEMVTHSYRVLGHLHVSFQDSARPWHEEFRGEDFRFLMLDQFPFHDCHGFAAFFGCCSYISRYLSSQYCSPEECTYLLKCSVVGLHCFGKEGKQKRVYSTMGELLRQGANANLSTRLGFSVSCDFQPSLWGIILVCTIPIVLDDSSDQASLSAFCTALMENVLSNGADINTSMFWFCSVWVDHSMRSAFISLEESTLSTVERYSTQRGFHHLNELGNFLRSHGAIQRQRCRLIQFTRDIPMQTLLWKQWPMYQLSQDQSDRLIEAADLTDFDEFKLKVSKAEEESLTQVISEIELGLTKADRVHGKTYVLTPPFKSEDGKT
jgi:NACHT domain